jgi:hypothetical protein
VTPCGATRDSGCRGACRLALTCYDARELDAACFLERNASAKRLHVVEVELAGAAAAAQLTAQVVRHKSGVKRQEAGLANTAVCEAYQLTRRSAALAATQSRTEQTVTDASSIIPGKHV